MSHSYKTSTADSDNPVILQQRIAELEARLAQREQELAAATQRTSAASHARHALHRALAANLPNGAAFVVDHELRYLLVEGEALSAAGMTSADLEGKLLEDALPPDLAQLYIPHYRQALAGDPFHWEHASHGRHYISHGTPLYDAQGEVYAVLVVSYDISERKQTEEALREAQETLELALEAAQMGIWQLDLTTDTSRRNLRHDQIFGYSELLPAWGIVSTRESVLPEDHAAFDEAITRSLETGIYQQEVRIRWPDGSIHWMHDFGRTIASDETGRPLRIAGVTLDITERKQAEEALRRSAEQYRTLFESIDEGFCTIEVLFDEHDTPHNYRFLEVNPAFERHTGLQQAVGKTIRELAPGHEAHWFEIYGKVALTGESIRFENRAAAMNRWFDVYAFRIEPAVNRRIAVLFTDITARKQTDEALRASEQRLRLLSRSLEARVEERTRQVRSLITQLTLSEQEERRRISQLLHDDLQQRLYGILFQLNALGHAFADTHRESALNTLAEIEQELNIAVQITRNLSVDLSPPILHNEGLVEAVEWLATQMERQHGLTVAVQAEDDLPRLHEDLRVLLFQTVRELLFNTVKHAGVTAAAVALTHTHDYICIEVSDQGQGFEAASGMGKATNGQGLARIQRRLQLISGHVEVRSAPGDGTQVILVIPANGQTDEPDVDEPDV